MGDNMKCENNSPVLLSNKHNGAFLRIRADQPFALPSFSEAALTDLLSFKLSGVGPKLENPDDIERLKRIMLRHESIFKEQLYELHRLYQVQRVLMEESKKGAANDPHSGSPSSNSSLIYNPDVRKLKGDGRSGDAHEVSKDSARQQLFFLPRQLDVKTNANKAHVSSGNMGQVAGASCHRPIIDLECLADESMECEMEEKQVTMDMPLDSKLSALHGGMLSGQDADMRALVRGHNLEEGRGRVGSFWKSLENCSTPPELRRGHSLEEGRRRIGSFWNSLENCSTPPELRRHQEVPVFPMGPSDPSRTLESLLFKQHSSHTRPAAANLLGFHLSDEHSCREKPLSGLQRAREERRKEWQLPGMEEARHQWSKVGEPKLPHWLLQESPPTSSGPDVLPITLGMQTLTSWKHQNLPFLLQNFDDGKLDSASAQRILTKEISSPWPTSGTKCQVGESWLKVPSTKPSYGYFPSPPTTSKDGQDYHKASQAAGVNDLTSPLFHMQYETGAVVPQSKLNGFPSFSSIDSQSSVHETHKGPTMFLPCLSSRGRTDDSPSCLWPQQQVSSLVTSSTYVHALPSQGSQSAFMPWWANIPTSGSIKTDSFTTSNVEFGGVSNRMTRVDITSESKGLVTPHVAEPKLCSKKLDFGLMPQALDLTLGLNLNAKWISESSNGLESSPPYKDGGQDRPDAGLKFVHNHLDLNIQLDMCSTSDILTRSKEEPENISNPGLPAPTGMVIPDGQETRQGGSSVKGIPRVSTTASISSPVQAFPFAMCREGSQADCLHGPRIPGGFGVVGKGYNGSGLMSCVSIDEGLDNSLSPKKARVDESIGGLDKVCLTTSLSKDSSGKHPVEDWMMGGSQCQTGSRFFSKLLSSLNDVHGGMKKNLDFDVSNDNKRNVTEADAAEILLDMGKGMDIQGYTTADGQGRSLQWLAGLVDTLPEGDTLPAGGASGPPILMETTRDQGPVLDSFELAVLCLKPVDPNTETCIARPVERCNLVEESPAPPSLRRRSLRRVRTGKDFQKEMLPSIASLSRQEINEDLQMIEGLVKSATEVMAKGSLLLKEDVTMPWSMPTRLLSTKVPNGKTKGSKPCKAKVGRQNRLFRVCSWGEVGRRKRMRRQPSQRLCVPPNF